ncbi:MAG: cation diffusion facilitator family transporter [Acutalibacteraceae bacterium]
MKSDKKILVAFLLNLSFAVIEFLGGTFTGSVAIISDSVHDLGDSISIGISYILEGISKKKPNDKYTFGYLRYSVLGSIIMTAILIVGSVFVIIKSVGRIINPVEINYNGMIIFAVLGLIINLAAAFFTRDGDSLNQKTVSLHMLEDVLGWAVVLVGAILMKFTDITYIDPAMSIGVSLFLLVEAMKNLKEIGDIFLEKTPDGIDVNELKEHIKEVDGVEDVHHLHISTLDGFNHVATLHIVTNSDMSLVKKAVREELLEHGINHSTIETETPDEVCGEHECVPNHQSTDSHHHHHHH